MSPYTEWAIEKKANRNYHVLSQLIKNESIDRVMTIDFLPHTFRRAAKIWIEQHRRENGGEVIYRDATSLCKKVSEKLFVYSTCDPVLSPNRMNKKIRKLADMLHFRNRVTWSFTPLYADYFGELEEELTVFDTVDNWATHPVYKGFRSRILKNYRYIAANVDRIFTVTQHLKDDLFSNVHGAHYIPNGVDVEHFGSAQPEPTDMAAYRHPRIGYIGVMQSRVDFRLIRDVSARLPNTEWIFVGPVWPDADVRQVQGQSNIHFLGSKPYQQLPAYIQHIDVGIIPHVTDEFVKSMNPLKMYEYLACGKPVVSTPVSGVEMFSGDISVARSADEFAQKIQDTLRTTTPQDAARRKSAVAPHSWERRVSQMLQAIESAAEEKATRSS